MVILRGERPLTAEARTALESLGITVTTFPDGSTTLSANTAPAQASLDNFINAANQRRATVTITQEILTVTRQTSGSYRGEAPSGGNLPGLPNIPGRASGGPVWPGTFLVGEEGPELVRMSGNGTVIPADETSQLLSGLRSFAGPGMVSDTSAGANAVRTVAAAAAPAATAGPVTVNLSGARIEGEFVMDMNGVVRLIDGRIKKQAPEVMRIHDIVTNGPYY